MINYIIITLSEYKTTKGALTYYIITKGEGLSKMLMENGEGVGFVMTDANKIFYKSYKFSLIYTNVKIFKTMWFFKTTVGSKWVNL